MAIRSTLAAGDLSSATAFGTVANTPGALHATTGMAMNATARFTATFTAPNTTNACVGVWLYIATIGSSTSWTVTLQENTVDTAATVTVALSALDLGWYYFEFAVPYTYTTTSAGAYRIKYQVTGFVSNGTFAAESTGVTAYFMAVDDRAGALALTDDLWVCKAMTVTGTAVAFGSRTLLTLGGISSTRDTGFALVVANGGSITFDRTATSMLTTRGYVAIENGGVYNCGTVASPIPSAYTATHRFSMASTNTMGFITANRSTVSMVGTRPFAADGYYRSRVVSGNGSTATPLILTDPVDWAVGDEICFETVSGLTQSEYKFVRTKISSTQYTLSATSGGAESALTNNHDGGWALHLTRNVILTTDNTAHGANLTSTNLGTGTTGFTWKWVRFPQAGSTSSANPFRFSGAGVMGTTDYCVFERMVRRGFGFLTTKTVETFTGNIICRSTTNAVSATTTGAILLSTSNNKTLVGWHIVDTAMTGLETITAFNHTFEDCHWSGNNRSNIALLAGVNISTSGLLSFSECGINASGGRGIEGLGATDIVFAHCDIGVRGTNTIEVEVTTDTYNTMLFDSCDLGSATRVNNNTLALPGTLLRFHGMNGNDEDHAWYTVNGQGRSTGAGLVDTNVKTAGSLGVRLAPETADGIEQLYKVLARAGGAVSILGFVDMNAAFVADGSTAVVVELYLPGSAEPDATTTLTKQVGWQPYILAADYSAGTQDSFAIAIVRAVNPNATAGVYAYHDDIYNGTNQITALDVWDEGMPPAIMFEQLGDAAAVWATVIEGQQASERLVATEDDLTTGKFLALK